MIQGRQIVLTGYIGCGKTTLFNKICNSNQRVAAGGQSVTQDVFSRNSAYGNGFRVLDTPGFGIKSKKVAHACAVACALSEGPINRLLVVIQAQRTDIMEQQFLKPMVTGLYKKFKNIITVVITHWDTITERELPQRCVEIQQEITKSIKSFNIHSLLFVSKADTGKQICQQIDQILLSSQAQNLILTENEFYTHFDLIELTDSIEDSLNEAKEGVTVKFRRVAKSISKFIADFPDNNPIMPEVMHALTCEIKNFADQEIHKFESDNNELFSKLYVEYNDVNVAYFIDVELKKELMVEVNTLMELCQRKMKVASNHCFNYIKKCPNCGEIWIKVAGCDGVTTCGNFPTNDDSQFQIQAIPKRYRFRFTEQALQFEDLGPQQAIQAKTYQDPGQGRRRGCGLQIEWGKIPPLEPFLVKELFDPGVLDYLAKEVSKKALQAQLKYNLKNEVQQCRQQIRIIQV